VNNACNNRRFRVTASYLPKSANINLPDRHVAPLLGVSPSEFCRDLWHQKLRVPGLSCGVVCMILCLAVSVEHRLVTDRQTTTAYTALAWHHAVKIHKMNVRNTILVQILWRGHRMKHFQSTRSIGNRRLQHLVNSSKRDLITQHTNNIQLTNRYGYMSTHTHRFNWLSFVELHSTATSVKRNRRKI